MRRTDRLFELIQILRYGRLHTARDMAERLEVSTRTPWRDMSTLIASGLPVEGKRGVGYQPLVLEFWGQVWTLAAWCETRDDFCSFRADRINSPTLTGEVFADAPGRDLAAWRLPNPGPSD